MGNARTRSAVPCLQRMSARMRMHSQPRKYRLHSAGVYYWITVFFCAAAGFGAGSMHYTAIFLGFFAGTLYIASHYMKTMVPLRVCEIASNLFFL